MRDEFEAWLDTDTGRLCASDDILYLSEYADVMLNRLKRAYEAGAESQQKPTLRDQFAMAAMSSLLRDDGHIERVCEGAYAIGDAMLKARSQT